MDDSEYLCGPHEDFNNDAIQKDLERMLHDPKHKLDELIANIRTRGFQAFSDIYVYPYGEKYLVIEGNRRTCAIKHLLEEEYDELDEHVQESLEYIPAKVLEYESEEELQRVKDSILGTLHLNSSLQWQPMQQAFAYYQKYMELLTRYRRNQEFKVNNRKINELASSYGLQKKEVLPELKVYVLYKTLRDNQYPVDGAMYSIIKEVIAKRKLCEEYFGFEHSTMEMTEDGMESLYQMCLSEHRPVSDPKKIAVLSKCYMQGRIDLLDDLLAGAISFQGLKDSLDAVIQANAFQRSLEKIKSEFDRIVFSPNPTHEERRIIEQILRHSENLRRSIDTSGGEGTQTSVNPRSVLFTKKGRLTQDSEFLTFEDSKYFIDSTEYPDSFPSHTEVTVRVETDDAIELDVLVNKDGEEIEGNSWDNPFVFSAEEECVYTFIVSTVDPEETGTYNLIVEA